MTAKVGRGYVGGASTVWWASCLACDWWNPADGGYAKSEEQAQKACDRHNTKKHPESGRAPMSDEAPTVTFACMDYTDGRRSRYSVYRGPMEGPRCGHYSVDTNEMTLLARVWKRPGQDFTHADMESWYATPEAPSFQAIVNGSRTGAPMD